LPPRRHAAVEAKAGFLLSLIRGWLRRGRATEAAMKIIRRMSLGLTIALLLPAAAAAQKTSYDYARHRDFASVKTFAFKDSLDVADRKEGKAVEGTIDDDPFVRERTRAAVAAELGLRGMRRDDADPDVFVTVRRTYKTEYVMYGTGGWGPAYGWGPTGWGPYRWGPADWNPDDWAWGWYESRTWSTEEIIKGTLAVDLEDADSGELIWRGVSEATAHPTSKPDHGTERVTREVRKVFKNYPPQEH
jgi:hypothetical protein